MRVTHEIEIACRCPSDNLPDVYALTVECRRVVKVEDIIAVTDEAAGMTLFQEDLAVWLHRRLNARVTLAGTHYGRVRTTVIAG